jgi:hypothetical protein
MKLAWTWGIASILFVHACPSVLMAQDPGGNDRIIPLLEVLARTSGASLEEILAATRDLAALGVPSSAGASLLLDRANVRYEPDPEVRAEALAAFVKCCPERDLRNRMVALRVVRIATPASEPDPRVRRAALGALASFQCGEASERIHDSALEAEEPDPAVRQLARELIAKGR